MRLEKYSFSSSPWSATSTNASLSIQPSILLLNLFSTISILHFDVTTAEPGHRTPQKAAVVKGRAVVQGRAQLRPRIYRSCTALHKDMNSGLEGRHTEHNRAVDPGCGCSDVPKAP